jgi:hypothetical protein
VSQRDIERLRALEKKWRAAGDAETKRADGDGLSDGEQGWHHGRGEQYDNCADELASLIAELGQEVGAVAPAWFYVRTPGADYDYTFTKTREEAIDLQDCDEPDEPIPLYTSPAHTSEARDAVVKGVRELAIKATAHWDAKFDDAALDVARRFTLDTEPQRRASLQVAIVEAMHRASNRSQS